MTRLSLVAGPLVSAVACWASPALADVRLPALFTDHMVLQQKTRAPIWGWATPGETVRITPSWERGSAATATADDRGRWRTTLSTPAAGGPYEITIAGAESTLTIRDVMVGEVWLCGGQSNMEWPVSASDNPAGETAAAKFPAIRCFDVKNTIAAEPQDDCTGKWAVCSPLSAANFTAVGYFFAREVHKELGVPVGIISTNWGGTVAQAWMSEEALRPFAEFKESIEAVRAARDDRRSAADRQREVVEKWWAAFDSPGSPGRDWMSPEFNDSTWGGTALPATWAGDLGVFDGIVYYRREFELPAGFADGRSATLSLGPIDDRDAAYVNGVLVGSTHQDGRWNQARNYTVPAAALRAGRNVVAVRVLDTAGPGGINGSPDQMAIKSGAGLSVALAGDWKHIKGRDKPPVPAVPGEVSENPNQPTVLYNGMIAPLAPFAVQGALWYQGESNRSNPGQYARLMPALIRQWREEFGGDFPFYFVQIAPYTYGGDRGETALLREAQASALSLPRTGMVVTTDIGDARDIHPRNKQEVGRRLALLALRRTYGKSEVVDSGPVFKGMRVEDGAARVTFESAVGLTRATDRGSERSVDSGSVRGFTIAGADKQFYVADAKIDGESVVVSSPRVPKPVAVRYAFEMVPQANLVNGAGLPAAPFRTDDWEGPLPPVEDSGATAHLTSDSGFKPLFNGIDLSGWVNVNGAPSTWGVKNGVIACSGIPTGLLRTDRVYENFVLELEWRHHHPQGNAGLFVWSDALTAKGTPFSRSVEVQVMVGQEGEWFTSDGDIFPIHGATMTPENGRGGSRAFPTEKRMKGAGEWNHYRVECIDGAVSLAVNGKVVTRGRECNPRRGYICLESEGTPIDFRNIRIKELPPATPPLRSDQIASEDVGFVPLYNGVDLAGWKDGASQSAHWKAEDWTLTYDGNGDHLWSEKSYRDFVLIADWRWTAPAAESEYPVILPSGEVQRDANGAEVRQKVQSAGDSGIYLRGNDKSQVNIWCWPVGSGEVYGYRTDAAMPAEVRAGVTPREKADAPIGQWNRFVITMRGDRLNVVLNGKTVIDNAQLPGVPAEGPIALQNHGDAIQFSNVLINELR